MSVNKTIRGKITVFLEKLNHFYLAQNVCNIKRKGLYSGIVGSFFKRYSVRIGTNMRLVELMNDSMMYNEPTKQDAWKKTKNTTLQLINKAYLIL